jgi:MFS family permease
MAQQYRVYRYRWIVLIIYMYVSALTQLFWLNFAAIETYMEDLLNVTAADVMWFTLVFPLTQVLLTLPAGMLIDRKGFKYGIGLGAILTGVFAAFRLISPESFTILVISQTGIALGQPFVLNGVTKLATTWFSPKEEGLAVGLGSFALFIGMMIALGLTPQLVHTVGFTGMLQIYSAMGVLGAIVFLLFTRSVPPTPPAKPDDTVPVAGWRSVGHILKNRDFVILGFIALIGTGVFNGLATWLEKILNELHNIPMNMAGTISAVLIISGMAGCIVIPVISDRIGRRKPFLIIASFVGATTIFLLIFAKSFGANLVNGIAIGFFFISALPIMLTMSSEINGPKFAGISVGYLQLLGNASAVVLVWLMEILRSASGGFTAPLAMLVSLLLVSFIISLLIRDTRPNSKPV